MNAQIIAIVFLSSLVALTSYVLIFRRPWDGESFIDAIAGIIFGGLAITCISVVLYGATIIAFGWKL